MLKFLAPGLAVAFTLVIFQGCNDHEEERPSVSFTTTALKASEAEPVTTLAFYLDQAPTEDITLNLDFGGTAKRGVDYECANQLVIKKGNKSANLTMTLLDDGEYERIEETITITIAKVTGNFVVGKKKTATAIVAFDGPPYLEMKLDWKAEEETTPVVMNLILFRMDKNGQGTFVIAGQGTGAQIIIQSAEADGTFGLSYHYFSGSCKLLNFKATMKCYNCAVNGSVKPFIVTGTYTDANLNPSRLVNVTQTFVKVGVDYKAFSSLTIPSSGSRTGEVKY